MDYRNPDNINKKEISDFITANIKQRKPIKEKPPKYNDVHADQDRQNGEKDGEQICNSFGRIAFEGFGPSMSTGLYARIDSESDAKLIYEGLLTKCWKMPPPKLIFSVTGGAKEYQPSDQATLKYFLRRGLVEAAVSTGAWIITGGTATGVMKLVGEAVNDYMTVHEQNGEKQCVALGIASWGCVAQRKELQGSLNKGSIKGVWPARYVNESPSPKVDDALLDANHTHFLLLDNGKEHEFGVEIDFRSKLEKHMSANGSKSKNSEKGSKVPIVLIVVEGGGNTVETVCKSAENDTPVVIIKGSGRAADMMGHVFQSKKTDEELKKELESKFPETYKKGLISKMDAFLSLRHKDKKKFISVLDLESGSVQDIETAIFHAIANAESDKEVNDSSSFNSKLQLAITLDMYDVARQSILATPPNETEILIDAMPEALVLNRADFVEHFINCDVDLKKFLTPETLAKLYDKCLKKDFEGEAQVLNHEIQKISETQSKNSTLKRINEVIIRLLQDASLQFYKSEKERQTTESKEDKKKALDVTNISEHPLLHLFIFSVLFNRQKLSEVFLNHVDSPISTALLGCAILRALANKAEKAVDEKSMQLHLDHSNNLFDFAVKVLTECNSSSKAYSHLLLGTKCDNLCNMTIFQFVEAQELMGFAEHSACQTKLTDMWEGSLKLTHWFRMLVTATPPFCLAAIPFMKFKFNCSSTSHKGGIWNNNKIEDQNLPLSVTRESVGEQRRQNSREHLMRHTEAGVIGVACCCCRRTDKILFCSALKKLYKAPITKFTLYVLSFIAMLVLFSYFLLIELSPDGPSAIEITVLVVFGTMLVEEFRQILKKIRRRMTFRMKGTDKDLFRRKALDITCALWGQLKAWRRSATIIKIIYQVYHMSKYIFLVMSFSMRMTLSRSYFHHARAMYSVSLVLSFMHLLQFFRASKLIGPKVIMIREMLKDLFSFLIIVGIFILSFGIAYHINMFPESPIDGNILANIAFYPYFQIYGEISLEDLKDGGQDCAENKTVWIDDITQRCPEKNAVVMVLLAVYLILTNVLLLNLLIAMFSHTFAMVKMNSTQVWHFHRISLVHEYCDRPVLPPPFSVFCYFWWLRCRYTWCCPCGCQARTPCDSKKRKSSKGMPRDEVIHKVEVLQRMAVDKILALKKKTRLRKETQDEIHSFIRDQFETNLKNLVHMLKPEMSENVALQPRP